MSHGRRFRTFWDTTGTESGAVWSKSNQLSAQLRRVYSMNAVQLTICRCVSNTKSYLSARNASILSAPVETASGNPATSHHVTEFDDVTGSTRHRELPSGNSRNN